MKKKPEEIARLRELILRENSVKAAAIEMRILREKAYRAVALMDITQMWVTEQERKEILKKRK